MPEAPQSDRDLVAAVRSGDRAAFAAVYDRYGGKLYDFAYATTRHREDAADVVADTFVRFAERLGQLRDPDALRPWLYAIARNECMRRFKSRKRFTFDSEERLAEVTDPAATPDDEAERVALRDLVWAAAAGLADRDRAMLDLHLRQGLDGAELGQAMGMSAASAYVQLNRLRAQVERSLGALLVARTGRADCDELDRLLGDWDGTLTPLIRKRIARHVETCQTCSGRKARMVSPWALLATVPVVLAPAGLRDLVLEQAWPVAAASVASGAAAPVTKMSTGAKAAIVTTIVAGGTALLLLGGSALFGVPGLVAPPSPTPTSRPGTTLAPPGQLTLSAQSLDLGLEATDGSITLSNTGGQPVEVTVRANEPWLSVEPGALVVDPGESVPLTIRADRAGLAPGPANGTVQLTWGRRILDVAVTLTQPAPAIPPSVGAPQAAIQCVGIQRTVTVSAGIDSEADLSSVTLYWENTAGSGGTAGSGSTGMSPSGGVWVADIGPFNEGAEVTMTVEAVDVRGLVGTGPTGGATMPVGPCL